LLVSPPEPPVIMPPIRPQDIEVAVCGAEKMANMREEINQRIAKSGNFFISKNNCNIAF
jgi:hypothetical protein